MIQNTITTTERQLSVTSTALVPAVIEAAGPKAKRRFVEYFTAEIANDNTRRSYMTAVRQFCEWSDMNHVSLETMEPTLIALYIKQLRTETNPRTGKAYADGSVKVHLAAIRTLFDYLVTGGVLPFNPASAVRGSL